MFNLPATKYPTTQRTVTGTVPVYPDDVVLNCDTSTGAVVIELAEIPDDYFSTQYKLYVVDISNNASVNNITIVAGTGQTINAAASIKITTNGGSIAVMISGNSSYTALQSSVPIGPSSFITVTYVQLSNLISTNAIIPNADYLLLDARFGSLPSYPTNVYLKGITTNKVSLDGQGIFFNADYQGVGDYSGITGFAGQLGLWNLTLTPVINNVCIWNNIQYLSITGANGLTNPTLDVVNWQPLAKQVNYGYIVEVDSVFYNATNNVITYRVDSRGNQVDRTTRLGFNSLNVFKWGDDKVTQNSVLKNSVLHNCNLICSVLVTDTPFFGNVLEGSTVLFGSATVNASVTNFSNNLFISSGIDVPLEAYDFLDNKFYNGKGTLSINTITGKFNENVIQSSSIGIVSSNDLSTNEITNSTVTIQSNTGNFVNNIFRDSTFVVNVITSGDIFENKITSSDINISTNSGVISQNIMQAVLCGAMLNAGEIKSNILTNVPAFRMDSNTVTGKYSNNIIENLTRGGITIINEGEVLNNSIFNTSSFTIATNLATGKINNNSVNSNGALSVSSNSGEIISNTVYDSVLAIGINTNILNFGSITNNSNFGIGTNNGSIGLESKAKGFSVNNGSSVQLQTITVSGFLAGVFIDNSSTISIDNLSSRFVSSTISSSAIDVITTGVFDIDRVTLVSVNLGTFSGAFNLASELTGTAMNGNSTIEITLDCSNPTIYDLPSQTLTIPNDVFDIGGRYVLANAAGLIIAKIVNCSVRWNTIFEPGNGTVTFNAIAVAGAVGNEIVSPIAPFSYNVVYRLFGSDYLEFSRPGNLNAVSNAVILT